MILAALAGASPAPALITPPVTIDGPSSQILGVGGVAMASDGSGGIVYLKSVNGIPHVFASRYRNDAWGPAEQVDYDQPFAASQPQIAAGPNGALLVVWVTGVATVKGRVQYGLFSARIGAGGSSFGPSQVVDPNVGEGVGVAPSLVGATPAKALVAYRVITYDFDPSSGKIVNAVQLRPGDVMAEIRVARLSGDRWSRLGAMNRNIEASMRAPSPANGPQIGEGLEGNAVLAWQEPDQTGTARIWLRRIFGSTPGPILQASPSSWEGKPVSADADAFSLSVTPYLGAQLGMRIAAGGSALAGRLLLNSLPPNYASPATALSGAVLADAGAPAPGPPDVAAAESQTPRRIFARLAFVSAGRLRQLGLGSGGAPVEITTPPGPAASGTEPVAAVDPDGGGLVAYPAVDPSGLPAVAVRQEFASGAAQTGLVSGLEGGPVGQLSIGRSGSGDGLVGFRQGEPGNYEVVGERVSSPPSAFKVEAPKKWLRPGAAKLHWQAAQSATGAVRYSVLLGGRMVKGNLRRRSFQPAAAQLGNGSVPVRVLATDALGEQLLSKPSRLRIDGVPPVVAASVVRAGTLRLRIADADSGVKAKSTRVDFGDGESARGGAKLSHSYERPGRYRVVVRASDRVGNRLRREFVVRAR